MHESNPASASPACGDVPAAPVPGILRLMLQRRIAVTALKVALVVGAILNVVNNGERVLAGQPINWWQFILNFVVPYCVSSYSAARNEVQAWRTRRE